MKLIITDCGDRSVGIPAQDWVIEVPFEKSDFDGDDLRMNLELFREDMIKAYEPYCECSCGASYDFELEEEAKYEEGMI